MDGENILSQIWKDYHLNELYDNYTANAQINDIFNNIKDGKINDIVLGGLSDGPMFSKKSIIRKIYNLINVNERKNIEFTDNKKKDIEDFVKKIGFNANSQLVQSCAEEINKIWKDGKIHYNIPENGGGGQLILQGKYKDILNDITGCVISIAGVVSFTKKDDGSNEAAIFWNGVETAAIEANTGKINGIVANKNNFPDSLLPGNTFRDFLANPYTIKIIVAIAAAAVNDGAADNAAIAQAVNTIGIGNADDPVTVAVKAAAAAAALDAVNDVALLDDVIDTATEGLIADLERADRAAAQAAQGDALNEGLAAAARDAHADAQAAADTAETIKDAAAAIIKAFGTGNNSKDKATATINVIKTLGEIANFNAVAAGPGDPGHPTGVVTATQAQKIVNAAQNNLQARIRVTNCRIIMLTILKILLGDDNMEKFINAISFISSIGFNENSQLCKACAKKINEQWDRDNIYYTIAGNENPDNGTLQLGESYKFILNGIANYTVMNDRKVSFTKDDNGRVQVKAKLCLNVNTNSTNIKLIRGKINDSIGVANQYESNVANRTNFDHSLDYERVRAAVAAGAADPVTKATIGDGAFNVLRDRGEVAAGDAGDNIAAINDDNKRVAYAAVINLRARIRVTNCRIIMLTLLKILGFEIDSVIKNINTNHPKQYPLYSKEYTITKLMSGISQDYLKASPNDIYNQFYGLILNILKDEYKPYITYMLRLLQIYFNNNNLFSVKINDYTQFVVNANENLKKMIDPKKILGLLSPEKTVENIRFNLDLKHDCGSLTNYDHPLLNDKDVEDIKTVDIYYNNTKYICNKNQLYTLIYILQLIFLNTAQKTEQVNQGNPPQPVHVPTELNNYFSKLYQNLLLIEYVSSRNKLTFDLNNILYQYHDINVHVAGRKTITQNDQKENYKYIQQGGHLFIIQPLEEGQVLSQNHMSNILSDIYKLSNENKYNQIHDILSKTNMSQILYTRSKTNINTKLRILYYYIITAGYMYNMTDVSGFKQLKENTAFKDMKNDNEEQNIIRYVLYKRDKYIGKTKVKVSIFDYIKRETLLKLKAAESNIKNELTLINSQNISENYVECLDKVIGKAEVDINCFTKSDQLTGTVTKPDGKLSNYLQEMSDKVSITTTQLDNIPSPNGYPPGLYRGGNLAAVAGFIKNGKLINSDAAKYPINNLVDIINLQREITNGMNDSLPWQDKINKLKEKLLSFALQNKINDNDVANKLSNEFKEFLQYLTVLCTDSDITKIIQDLLNHIVQPDDFINIINYLNIAYIANYQGKKATSVKLVDYKIWFVANSEYLKKFYEHEDFKLTTDNNNEKRDAYTNKVLVYLCIFVNELIKYCNKYKVSVLTQYFNEGYHKFDNVLEVQEQKRMKQAIKNALKEINDENKRNLSMIPIVNKTMYKNEHQTEKKEQNNNTTLFETFNKLRNNNMINFNNKHLLNQAKYVGGDIINASDSNVKTYRYIQKYIENTLKIKGYKLNKADSQYVNNLINQYEEIENKIVKIMITALKGVNNTPYTSNEADIDYDLLDKNSKKQKRDKSNINNDLINLEQARDKIMDELNNIFNKLIERHIPNNQHHMFIRLLNTLS